MSVSLLERIKAAKHGEVLCGECGSLATHKLDGVAYCQECFMEKRYGKVTPYIYRPSRRTGVVNRVDLLTPTRVVALKPAMLMPAGSGGGVVLRPVSSG
jgi:hypothetical protein